MYLRIPQRLERSAFGVFCTLLLAPVIAQGLWRPLVHVFGQSSQASIVTYAALAICATISIIQACEQKRSLLLSLLVGGLASVGTTVGFALGLAGLLTLFVVALVSLVLSHYLSTRLPSKLDGLAKQHKVLFLFYTVVAVATVIKTAQLSIFIGDSTRLEMQVLAGEKFIETHSCLTAYVHADTLAKRHVNNLYDEPHWVGSHGFSPAPLGHHSPYNPFHLDYYAYPPPFLLVMAPLAVFSGDFAAQRALWFGINGVLLALGLWIVARWLDGPNAHRVLLLSPLLFGSIPVLATLQVGNFQIAVVTISILAMVAFQEGRPVIGGALLAFAILSKISPGLFGIVLLGQRRYGCAAWTAGFGVVFLALSVLMIGVHPMMAFVTYTLPRLSSGEIFAFMDDDPFSILTNLAPFGIPFKMGLIGFDVGDPWVLGRRIGRLYSMMLAIFVFLTLRRSEDRRKQAVIWMSLLVLAALQSPFAPGYVSIGLLWAITLCVVEVRRFQGGFILVLLWLLLTAIPPISSRQLSAVYSVLQSTLALILPVGLILRCRRGLE